MDDISQRIGRNIRRLRLEHGISQVKLARLAGIHSKYLGEVERAEKHITVDCLRRIAAALNIKLSTFFELIESG